ncbi:DNA alkylation repair protein [Microbacterium sp. E-13]|uniref:DNA alkylation repair protein n=1 Tax=Microbacterium sp. E-13 TaxID=3404048 RepID=UPI003CF181CF
MTDQLAATIRADLRAAADPSRAAGQQAYMKSAMPFLGVRVPQARMIARRAAAGITDAASLRATALQLWDGAEHREERCSGSRPARVRGGTAPGRLRRSSREAPRRRLDRSGQVLR